MGNEYLRAFVIGSSAFVILPYFYAVSRFKPEKFNFDYMPYTFLAPIGLGLVNMYSLLIAKIFNISTKIRFLLTSIITPTLVLLMVFLLNIYNYTVNEWIEHIIKLYLLYFIVFNGIVYTLDKNV
jgi:hypothetical protein